MNQRKRLSQRQTRRRRAHRKTAKKGKRSTHRRTQRGGDIMDFFRSINPFGSDDPATEQASVPAQETARTNESVAPTNGTIYRNTTANFNNSMPEAPEQPPMPDPRMRRRRNYRKNL